MALYNFQYDPRTDPTALFAQGARNVVGGLLQGRQMRNLANFAGGMDPEATAMQIVTSALSKRISPQIAMGLGSLQQKMQPSVGAQPWASTQMTPAQRQNWFGNYGRGVTIQTGQKLLEPGQRQEVADTEFREKVGLSPAEKNLARKSAEELLKSTKGRWWSYGFVDYTQKMMLENYKSWRAENTYDEQTPRKQKELDDLWDAKMALWSKSGIRFDKDNIIGKNEIVWDPNDPEVKKLREGTPQSSQTGMQLLPSTEKMAPSPLQPARVAKESDMTKLSTESRSQAVGRLNQIYESLDPQIKGPFLTAWGKAEKAGVTAEEFLAEWLKR